MDRRLNRRHITFLSKTMILLVVLLIARSASSQENVTTLGIQLKPMVPSKYFGNGTQDVEEGDLKVNFQPNLGWNFGMVVRRGLTKNWSLETGICIVQRNFTMTFEHPELQRNKEMKFRYICYEIPIQGLVFVKLTDQLFMNASGGLSLDMYPSNVESSAFEMLDTNRYDFYQKTYRNGWIQAALLANYGFEYRTRESGYFYLGASYHRPFASIGTTKIVFEKNTDPERIYVLLKGNYLTADFRYFFNEKPERKKPKS